MKRVNVKSNEVEGISLGLIAGRALGFTNYQQLYGLKSFCVCVAMMAPSWVCKASSGGNVKPLVVRREEYICIHFADSILSYSAIV